jgi:hypothetical protein
MRRANIYDAKSNEYIAYLSIINESNGYFIIFEKGSNERIAYGNLRENRIDIYDPTTNVNIEYGWLSGQRFDLYDSKTNKYTKYGMFS